MKTSFWSDFFPFFPPFSSLPFISPSTPFPFAATQPVKASYIEGLGGTANTLRIPGRKRILMYLEHMN